MKILFVFLALQVVINSVAQQKPPTEAELQAMMQKLKKQADSIMNDPRVKKNATSQSTKIDTSRRTNATAGDASKWKLPPKDTARIRVMPKKTFSPAELKTYLNELHTLLVKKLPAEAVRSANEIAQQLGNDPVKLESAAMLGWQKGASAEALLLIVNGASRATGDGLLLTNASGILDMSGLSEKAIPILRTVIAYGPENAIAYNNLGQSYVQLGLIDSAMYYFGRCLSISPQHPEANTTAGVIEIKKGNKTKAKAHFENAIRGGFNYQAVSGLKSIDRRNMIADLVRPKVKLPEYFNQFKYHLPRQCEKVDEAYQVLEEHNTFKRGISAIRTKYFKLEHEAKAQFEAKGGIQAVNREIQARVAEAKSPFRPFQILAATMVAEIELQRLDDFTQLVPFNKENRRQYSTLLQQYENEYSRMIKQFDERDDEDCCGEGNTSCCEDGSKLCESINELRNKYLPQLAVLNREWQSRNMAIEKKYFDEKIFWSYFSAFDIEEYRMRFFGSVKDYLGALISFCHTKILEPCGRHEEPDDKEKPEDTELEEFECPFNLEIPFVIGKFEASCEKLSFKMGQGAVFKYENNFVKRQSTLSVGIGFELYKLERQVAGFTGGVSAAANMSVFLNLDRLGAITDAGVQYGAKAGGGVEFEKGEKIKVKKEMISKDVSVGWRFGIHSGIGFDEGPFKHLLDKPEIQKNKNVQIYKPPSQ